MKMLSSRAVQLFILVFVVLAAHCTLLVVPQIENPDAALIYSNLSRWNFPFDYLKALADFQTYDFQPVRDFTLYLDIWIFNQTGLVISVMLNCLIWALACFQVMRILELELKTARSWHLLIFVSCFAVYPIFGPSINWGIARKHLLAFLFIVSATHSLIQWEQNKKSMLPVIVFYLLSVLSLPIAIGWPLWVFFREGGINSLKEKESRSLIMALGILSILLVGINFAYYKTSPVFLETYVRKAASFDWRLILINLGFQFRQMIYPYDLGIFYEYDLSALIYFGFFLLLIVAVIFYSRKYQKLWMWPLFGITALIVTATTPETYFDTYVIVPTFALFMTLMTSVLALRLHWAKYATVLGTIWFAFTFNGNAMWSDPVLAYKKGFEVSPNCTNALILGRRYYEKDHRLPSALYTFIQNNQCLNATSDLPPNMALKLISFESLMMYFEDKMDPSYRKLRAEELSKRSLPTLLMYASLLAKMGNDEDLEELMKKQNDLLQGRPFSFQYEFVFSDIVPAYCRDKRLTECNEFVKRFKKRPEPKPYF